MIKIKNSYFILFITDLEMPMKDGFETAKEITNYLDDNSTLVLDI